MGAHGGPNMTEDGAVFYYDTGNSKSYAGEPTTNLMPPFPEGTTVPPGANWGSYEYSVSVVDSPIGNHPLSNQKWVKFVKTSNTNGRAGFLSQSYIANTINTFSCYVYAETGNSRIIVNSDNGGLSIISSKVDYDVSKPNTVQRIHGIWTQQVNGGSLIGIRGGSGDAIGTTFYITGFQVEEKPHPTQVATGTRSVTEGLKDFTKGSTLDISTVSFDSNAQIEFDGSDDYIALPSSLRSIFSAAPNSVELVLKKSSADQSNMVVFDIDVTRWNLNYNEYVAGQWSFDFYDGTEHVIAGGNYDNNYVHFVLQQLDDGTMELYANGELKGTEAAGNLAPNGNSIRIGSRSNGDSRYFKGELPMIKVYNRALTAEEVAENFNGIRSRFGI